MSATKMALMMFRTVSCPSLLDVLPVSRDLSICADLEVEAKKGGNWGKAEEVRNRRCFEQDLCPFSNRRVFVFFVTLAGQTIQSDIAPTGAPSKELPTHTLLLWELCLGCLPMKRLGNAKVLTTT